MRPAAALLTILTLAACQDTLIHSSPASAPCVAYLECLETLAAGGGASAAAYRSSLEQARTQYGVACDQTPATRQACDQACTQGLAACPRPTGAGPGPDTDGPPRPDAGNGAEDTNATCNDGIDNDGDGYLDCVDYSCARNPDVTVCGSTAPTAENTDQACTDGLDNDGDGYRDCDDFDCSRNAGVTACETCDACIARVTSAGHSCHAPFAACGSTVSCQAYTQCVQGCAGASSCLQGCAQSEPTGAMLYSNVINCIDPLCGARCP